MDIPRFTYNHVNLDNLKSKLDGYTIPEFNFKKMENNQLDTGNEDVRNEVVDLIPEVENSTIVRNTNNQVSNTVLAKRAYDYLTSKKNIGVVQALGIIGNIQGESGFNHNIKNSIGAYGLNQWLGARKAKLLELYGSNPTFEQQLDYLVDEHTGKYPGLGWNFMNKGKELGGYYQYSRDEFNNSKDIDTAVKAWNQGFGRPGAHELRNEVRSEFVKNFADKYNILKGKSGIKIKPENKGKFTRYCGGNVTQECINRGKSSSNPVIRKRAVFAENARKFKHRDGGVVKAQLGLEVKNYTIKPGDNLGSISKSLGVNRDSLQAWNGISDPNKISAGQELTYKVNRFGDIAKGLGGGLGSIIPELSRSKRLKDATDLVIKYENFKPEVYHPDGDKPTIGHGLTDKRYVSLGRISEEDSKKAVVHHLDSIDNVISKKTKYYKSLPANKQIALLSLAYNTGLGSFLNNSPKLQGYLNKGDYKNAAAEMDHGATKSGFRGLIKRRKEERELFLNNKKPSE